jgi:ATP-dependent Clp protease ATP-binding subunit ClpC
MFERFTDRARQVVVLAQEEARMFKHDRIGTEHLLLGLLREGEGIGARALNAVGVTLGGVRTAVEERAGIGDAKPKGHMPFSPGAKKVLELSLRQAIRLGHDYIGTEHILLGITEEAEGVAAQILIAAVDGGLERVREEVIAVVTVRSSPTRARMRRVLSRSAASRRLMSDDIVVRLEAIEARLSSIEALLRAQGEEREAQ